MYFKNGKPRFKIRHIKPLWSSKIMDLEELRDRMSNNVLVAFDIESSLQKIHEFGLAILSVGENTPRFCIGRCQFFNDNNIQAFNIEAHERNQKQYEFKRHGETIKVDNVLQAGPAIEKILMDFQNLGKFILVGYDLKVEFKWISEHCPSLASYFSAWVDVQELVAAQCNGLRVGLTGAIRGLDIIDNRHRVQQHYAANDAVRDLAVLAGLLSGKKVITTPQCKDPVKRGSSLAPLKDFCYWTQYPFSVRVVAADGGSLPNLTPRDLAELFAAYNLEAVGLKGRNSVDTWWMAFHAVESLRDFIRDIESLRVEGKALKAVLVTGIER